MIAPRELKEEIRLFMAKNQNIDLANNCAFVTIPTDCGAEFLQVFVELVNEGVIKGYGVMKEDEENTRFDVWI